MKFKKENLIELLNSYEGFECEGLKLVADEYDSSSRWESHHSIIFEFEGKFYSADYSRGLTENQDSQPFQYSPEEVECIEVQKIEKIIYTWEPVK